MADERVDTYKRVHNLSDIDGVEVKSDADEGIITTTVNVINENGSQAVSKEIGKYITIEIQDINCLDEQQQEKISTKISNEIRELVGCDKTSSVLVVGLGNIYVTPDALGPKVVQNVEITRHILNFAKEFAQPGTRSVSAIAPGVLGTTGIETSEIVTSIARDVNADIIVVIDSLASQSMHRVGNTIQLSNTGITPGAGVGNKRDGINQENLGVPVIAIGVPTVVDMATITNEAIDKMIDSAKSQVSEFSNSSTLDISKAFESLEEDTRYDMISNILNTENYIVTPKEIDEVIQTISKMISSGVNMALQG